MNYKILFIIFISCSCNLRKLKKKSLFDETKIKKMKLKNRIFRSSVIDNSLINGHLTEECLKLYEELSKNEVGTILTGAVTVTDYNQLDNFNVMRIDKDEYINEYKKLVDIVHKNGANILMQLLHVGINTLASDKIIYGPSVVKLINQDRNSIEITKEDILRIENAFVDGSIRAKKAGFDGIELHGAHFYLISTFLSPLFNHRNDEYGGNDLNRARIVIEIIKKMREKVGNDFIIGIKLNTEDGNENGISEQGFLNTCKLLENAGIDFIEVSGTNFIKGKHNKPDFYDIASKLADYVNIPVILLGGVRDLKNIDFALNNSKIQYIGLARPLLCEPDIVKRWKNGDKSESKCISCFACLKDLKDTECIFNKNKK
jgi:2,4-dienoyl-CoA reductase-like NADH-dependent reductase (Old Yellow Enzyme family)